MENTISKYINIYLKRNLILIALISVPISFLFFIISLFYDVLDYDVLASFFPIIIGALCFVLSIIYPYRFKRMIKYQEDMYNIEFNDNNAQPLYKNSIIFLSDDWLIISGEYAFYRGYVKSFSQKIYRRRYGNDYKIIVNAVDGRKYKFWATASHDIDKYREWRLKK